MKNLYFYLLISALLVSCGTTKGVKNQTVKEAIDLQTDVVNDPLFNKILKELESEKAIEWNEGRTNFVKEKLSDYISNVDWLIEKYNTEGAYPSNSVFLWRKWNPFSSTTAVTTQCVETTKLNKWKLNRDKYSILNTLIHERVHSFCLVHPSGQQTRQANMCDASYVAGDLAEILILYRKGIKERTMDKPICPKLIDKVKQYNLIEIK
jgi:hypothetical protein